MRNDFQEDLLVMIAVTTTIENYDDITKWYGWLLAKNLRDETYR